MKDNSYSSLNTPMNKRTRSNTCRSKAGSRLSKYFEYFLDGRKCSECDYKSQTPITASNAKRHLLNRHPELPVFEHHSALAMEEDSYNSTLRMVDSLTANTQPATTISDRARTVKFSDREDEVMIREYHLRRHFLDSGHSAAIKVNNRVKHQKWEEITEKVNQVDSRAIRSVEMVKTRYKNMVSDYKRYKAEMERTGETPSREQPFHKILEEVGSDDCLSQSISSKRRSNSLLSTKEEFFEPQEDTRDCADSHLETLLHQSVMLETGKKRKTEVPLIYTNGTKSNSETNRSKDERIKDLQIEVLEKQKCLLDFKILYVQQKLGLLTQEQVGEMFKEHV